MIHHRSLTARPWKMLGKEDDPFLLGSGNFSGAKSHGENFGRVTAIQGNSGLNFHATCRAASGDSFFSTHNLRGITVSVCYLSRNGDDCMTLFKGGFGSSNVSLNFQWILENPTGSALMSPKIGGVLSSTSPWQRVVFRQEFCHVLSNFMRSKNDHLQGIPSLELA